jgi:broad specificity phosphatase PhoE
MSYWRRTMGELHCTTCRTLTVDATNPKVQTIFLVTNGETEWSRTGQYAGSTELPLTDRGERDARELGQRLKGLSFARVFTSPLQRALSTCELAGLASSAKVERDISEWNYGNYEGFTIGQIRQHLPEWDLFKDGCPGGENAEQVAQRADQLIRRLRAGTSDVLLISGEHFLRVLAARWLGLAPSAGRYFLLRSASLSALGYDRDPWRPAVRFWDDARHDGA